MTPVLPKNNLFFHTPTLAISIDFIYILQADSTLRNILDLEISIGLCGIDH